MEAAPQFSRGQKSEKCIERAESLTETLATQARVGEIGFTVFLNCLQGYWVYSVFYSVFYMGI